MNYGIVIFPSKKLQDIANSYRKRFDPHYALISPHITIKNSFEANDEQIKDISRNISDIVQNYKAFPLKVLKASSFQPVTNTIYLKVEPTAELEGLYQAFQDNELFPGKDEYSFVPHITIGQKLSNQEHSDIFGQLSMIDLTHEETIDRLHLLYQLDNGSWTVYETFHLREE